MTPHPSIASLLTSHLPIPALADKILADPRLLAAWDQWHARPAVDPLAEALEQMNRLGWRYLNDTGDGEEPEFPSRAIKSH